MVRFAIQTKSMFLQLSSNFACLLAFKVLILLIRIINVNVFMDGCLLLFYAKEWILIKLNNNIAHT